METGGGCVICSLKMSSPFDDEKRVRFKQRWVCVTHVAFHTSHHHTTHPLCLCGIVADKASIWWMQEDIEFPNNADVELNHRVHKQPPASTATGWHCYVEFNLHTNFTFWLIKRLFVRTWVPLLESLMCNKGCWFCCDSGLSLFRLSVVIITPGPLVKAQLVFISVRLWLLACKKLFILPLGLVSAS